LFVENVKQTKGVEMRKGSLPGKRIGFFMASIAILMSGAGFLLLTRENNANAVAIPQQLIRPVKVMVLSGSVQQETRTFPGVVQATREVDLAFRVGGPLVELYVKIGQLIQKGEVIARIDDRDFIINRTRLSAALDEAKAGLKAMKTGARSEDIASLEAQLKAAQVRMDDAGRNFERQKNLLADHVIAQAEYDNALAVLDTAKANVEVTQQALKKANRGARVEDIQAAEAGIQRLQADFKAAENALKDVSLVAPFTGYVDKKHVENFENVGPGRPIVTLLDFSSVEIRTAIPEDVVIREASIVDISCTLDAFPGQSFSASIKEIGRKTDSANQSYPLTVSLATNQGLAPQPGMAATLKIKLKKPLYRDTHLQVPASAVIADPEGRSCVWKVDMQTLTVIRTPVTTGELNQDTIQILSGLNDGDRVVIAGARFLQPDQEIRILSQTKGGAE
jgi:membrane fusion protein, multidrug efflux system